MKKRQRLTERVSISRDEAMRLRSQAIATIRRIDGVLYGRVDHTIPPKGFPRVWLDGEVKGEGQT